MQQNRQDAGCDACRSPGRLAYGAYLQQVTPTSGGHSHLLQVNPIRQQPHYGSIFLQSFRFWWSFFVADWVPFL